MKTYLAYEGQRLTKIAAEYKPLYSLVKEYEIGNREKLSDNVCGLYVYENVSLIVVPKFYKNLMNSENGISAQQIFSKNQEMLSFFSIVDILNEKKVFIEHGHQYKTGDKADDVNPFDYAVYQIVTRLHDFLYEHNKVMFTTNSDDLYAINGRIDFTTQMLKGDLLLPIHCEFDDIEHLHPLIQYFKYFADEVYSYYLNLKEGERGRIYDEVIKNFSLLYELLPSSPLIQEPADLLLESYLQVERSRFYEWKEPLDEVCAFLSRFKKVQDRTIRYCHSLKLDKWFEQVVEEVILTIAGVIGFETYLDQGDTKGDKTCWIYDNIEDANSDNEEIDPEVSKNAGFKAKPDFVLHAKNKVLIIDAKYKMLAPKFKNQKLIGLNGVKAPDRYQIEYYYNKCTTGEFFKPEPTEDKLIPIVPKLLFLHCIDYEEFREYLNGECLADIIEKPFKLRDCTKRATPFGIVKEFDTVTSKTSALDIEFIPICLEELLDPETKQNELERLKNQLKFVYESFPKYELEDGGKYKSLDFEVLNKVFKNNELKEVNDTKVLITLLNNLVNLVKISSSSEKDDQVRTIPLWPLEVFENEYIYNELINNLDKDSFFSFEAFYAGIEEENLQAQIEQLNWSTYKDAYKVFSNRLKDLMAQKALETENIEEFIKRVKKIEISEEPVKSGDQQEIKAS